MLSLRPLILMSLAVFGLASCGTGHDEDAVAIAFIGETAAISRPSRAHTPLQSLVQAARADGLVAIDQKGQIVPALAERWIVTDEGKSYIFRLRDADWPNGTRITAQNIRTALLRKIARQRGTTLGRDLAIIEEVRAMAGRVIEIRLKSPMPQFLQLLSQSELGLEGGGGAIASMRVTQEDKSLMLRSILPEQRGLPQAGEWDALFRPVQLHGLEAKLAVERFENGEVDVVLNGRAESLALADLGPLSRGTVRVDPVSGLFGLQIRHARGVLSKVAAREALSMAIDREALMQALNLGGWYTTTRIVPALANGGASLGPERWDALSIEERRANAAAAIASWKGAEGAEPIVTIYLPEGPGSDIIFTALQEGWSQIGVSLQRTTSENRAEIVLYDAVARYLHPRWFLNTFACINTPLCQREADNLTQTSLSIQSNEARQEALKRAENILLEANYYMPIGAPLRWALVRGVVEGFDASETGVHPLYPFSLRKK